MLGAHFHRHASPLERLEGDAKTGSVQRLSYWLKTDASWFRRPETTNFEFARKSELEVTFAQWKKIEDEFGVGAALNLDHPLLDLNLSRLPRAVRTVRRGNAETYKNFMGREWLWHP